MSDNSSHQLDGDKLGERPGDEGMPGVGDYPPDTPMGVDDPNLVGDDDVATREARMRDERTVDSPDRDLAGADAASGDLLPPDGDDGNRDDVQQMLGETAGADDDTEAPAEVDAMHVRDRT